MSVKETIHNEPITFKVGTITDFGNLAFIVDAMSTEIDETKFNVYRGVADPTYFEIKAEGHDRFLRFRIEDLVRSAVLKLHEEIQNDDPKTDVG